MAAAVAAEALHLPCRARPRAPLEPLTQRPPPVLCHWPQPWPLAALAPAHPRTLPAAAVAHPPGHPQPLQPQPPPPRPLIQLQRPRQLVLMKRRCTAHGRWGLCNVHLNYARAWLLTQLWLQYLTYACES